jgi:fused signal recognition particle receptor
MFGGLKKLFRRAEEEVEEKIEERIEEAPIEEVIEKKAELKKKAQKKIEKEPIPEPEEEPEPIEEEKTEVNEKIEKKVRFGFGKKLKQAIGVKVRLSESEIDDITWNLQMGLMQSDVALEVAEAITERLKEKFTSENFKDPKTQVRQAFKETLVEILESGGSIDFMDYVKKSDKPLKIVLFGINGTGKTTTISKIAYKLKEAGYSVVLAAGDTFRAGAQEQLQVHADRLGIKLIHHQRGGDAAAVVFDAIKHAEANNIDIVLADTSGRMQSNTDLMGEMEKIVRVNNPDLKIFIGDALAGNDAVEQAREFNDKIGIDASILAKVDASKGGAALSISYITKKPIAFLGMGQEFKDLETFNAKEFVEQVL